MQSLKNKVAVLVGAAKTNSIGEAIAKNLALEGCNLVLTCRQSTKSAEKLAVECSQFKISAFTFTGDATKEEDNKKLAQFIDGKFGKVDILINCIGTTKSIPYNKIDLIDKTSFNNMLATNTIAPFLTTQALMDLLLKSKDASIINISATAGINGRGSSIPYAVSKGALNTLTIALAQALTPNIRVNAVCPGFVDSSWWHNSFKDKPEKYIGLLDNMKNNSPLNKVTTPQDVANAVLYLIKSSNITGELIRVDSGVHIKA